MKIQISVADLSRFVKTADFIPQGEDNATCFLFRHLSDDSFEILSYGGRCLSCVRVEGLSKVEGDGAFLVPRKRLTSLLSDLTGLITIWEEDVGVIKILTEMSRKPLTLASSPADSWPFWDQKVQDTIQNAPNMTVKATDLVEVLRRTRPFLGKDDKEPQFQQVESRAGTFLATNKLVLVSATHGDFVPEVEVRIFHSDLSAVLSWLGELEGQETVEVFSSDKLMVIRRQNGSILGESRALMALPKINLDPKEPLHKFTFGREEAIRCLRLLRATAPASQKEGRNVVLTKQDDTLVLSMDSMAKGENEMTLPCSAVVSNTDMAPFGLSDVLLEQILRDQSEDQVTMGVVVSPKVTAVQFVDEVGSLKVSTTQLCVAV